MSEDVDLRSTVSRMAEAKPTKETGEGGYRDYLTQTARGLYVESPMAEMLAPAIPLIESRVTSEIGGEYAEEAVRLAGLRTAAEVMRNCPDGSFGMSSEELSVSAQQLDGIYETVLENHEDFNDPEEPGLKEDISRAVDAFMDKNRAVMTPAGMDSLKQKE